MLRRSVGDTVVAIAGFLSLVMFSAGCAAAVQPSGDSSGGTGGGPVGKATVAFVPMSSGNWDPATTQGAADNPLNEAMYNRLTETEIESMALRPGIAEAWTISPDGLTYEFKIRKGVKFHNGDEVTPEDVVFSANRYHKLALPASKASIERLLEGVEARGDSVIFRVKVPDWTALNTLSGYGTAVPKKYVEQVGDEGFAMAPVGTGPFKFVSGSKQEYIEFEAVDDHFLTPPGVKRLRYVILPEETTRLAMVQTGEADLAQVSTTSLRGIKADSRLREIKSSVINGLRLYTWGQDDPQSPMSKLEVRQALSLAIDRRAIAQGIYQGYAIPVATGYWNPAEPGWPEWGFDYPKQDLAKAKELLAKAGYPDGKGLPKFTFHTTEYGGAPLWTQAAPAIAAEWQKLGLQVEIRTWEWGVFQQTQRAGTFGPNAISVATANATGERGYIYIDLHASGLSRLATGITKGAHPEVVPLVDQWMQERDEKKREPLQKKILLYARDNLPDIPVVAINALWAAGPRLLEYIPRKTHSIGNMYTIKVTP